MKSWVYFLRQTGGGPVKIGCSKTPELRLEAFRPWCPFPIELAAFLPGEFVMERRFHAKFLADRVHYEWFNETPELRRTIDEIRSGVFDVASLPNPRRLPPRVDRQPWTEEQRRSVRVQHQMRSWARRGFSVPDDVQLALTLYAVGPYHPEFDPMRSRRPDDLATVERWLAANWVDPPRRTAA